MDSKTLLVALTLAAGIAAGAQADMISTGDGIAVKESTVATPARGMTMNQVASKFGAPTTKVPAVGEPPISRWEYPGFVVYFEHERVIHTVVEGASSDSSTAPAQPASTPSAAPSPSGDTASGAGDAAVSSGPAATSPSPAATSFN